LDITEILLNLPHYQITWAERRQGELHLGVRYTGPVVCAFCEGKRLHRRECYQRSVRHEDLGQRACRLILEGRKFRCLDCGREFRQRFPGILKGQRVTEAFRAMIYTLHRDGISRSRLGRREKIGAATVERYFQYGLQRQFAEQHPRQCPIVLGIDEHFFTRRKGFATTLCDLRHHKIYDVVLGRSEASLAAYFQRLEGRAAVKVVCMDLSVTYRALVRRYFPNARIVADRFHVIRLINHHFLACWRDLDPVASKHRGLVSLMRRHRHNLKPEQRVKLQQYLAAYPALETIYRFKQKLCYLLLRKHRTKNQCSQLAPRLLAQIEHLCHCGLAPLVQLGETLRSWQDEIACMWRFTKNNGITEGFHNKMETLSRQAYGFRNFENYRRRVKILCA
jgi:transposase